MNFVIEFQLAGELAGKPLPSFNALEADTLPLAIRAVQKTLDSTEIESAVIYVPVRIMKASREVRIEDMTGRNIAVDAALVQVAGTPVETQQAPGQGSAPIGK